MKKADFKKKHEKLKRILAGIKKKDPAFGHFDADMIKAQLEVIEEKYEDFKK